LFLAIMALLAGASLADAIAWLAPFHPARFVLYLGISLVASVMKARLPGVRGSMSVNFFFFLIGVVSLTLVELLAIGFLCAITQTYWKPKSRPTLSRAIFNVSAIVIALRVAYEVFHLETIAGFQVQFHLKLILMAAAYFLANTLPVAIIIGLAERQSLLAVWREAHIWAFSYYLVGAAFAAIFHALEKSMGWEASTLVLPVLYSIHRAYRIYLNQAESEKAEAQLQKTHAEEVSALHLRTIQALALAIEAKDQSTHNHLHRVQFYSTQIGKLMGLPEPEMQALRASAVLHDIGKLAVPEHILSKPGRLTPEEFEKMKIHTVVGAEILESVDFPYPVVPIVRHHHERWDGSGYPDGLRGENIPVGARILSVVDCFDALTSNRQYRPALPVDAAVKEVVSLSGRGFDPSIVALLEDNYKQWEEEVRSEGAPMNPSVPLETAAAAAAAATATDGPGVSGTQREQNAPAVPENQTHQSANGESSKSEFVASISAARSEVLSLLELNKDMSSPVAMEEMLRMVAVRVQKLVPHDTFAVYRLEGGHLVPEHIAGEDYRKFSSLRIPLGEGLTGWVAQNRKPIVNGNPAVESGYLEARRSANGADQFPVLPPLGGRRGMVTGEHRMFTLLRSGLCVPLEVGDTLVGTLSLYSVAKDAFTRDHVRVLTTVATQLAPALQNGLHLRHAESESLTDFLTGLPNMRSLQEKLQQELHNYTVRGLPFSVLLCDLDGFKQVNDRFGHMEGNRVLQMAASTLRNNCREQDFVARLGGDEFVLILPGGSEMQAQLHVQRLTRAIELEGKRMLGADTGGEISASFGVAHVPQDGLDIDQILDVADNRMFRAKTMRKAERIESATSLAALRSGIGAPAAQAAEQLLK